MKTDNIKEIHIFSTMKQMADYAVKTWAEISHAEIKHKKFFSAALSGGKTPAAFYEKLSGETSFSWEKTHIFMVDERFVPYESDENNYHMINRMLLRHVNVMPRNIHPILTSEASPQASAERYEQDILSYCKTVRSKIPLMDLILLGIGEDGHTASLFPGTPALREKKRLATFVVPGDRSKNERITITFPFINNAKTIIFLVAGENKAKKIKEIIEGKNSSLPAAMVRPAEGKLMFLLDEAAASLLTAGKRGNNQLYYKTASQ
jgi:6-phosphogluconolactonase